MTGGLQMNNLMGMMGGAASVGALMEAMVTVKVKFEPEPPPPYSLKEPTGVPLVHPKVWETAAGIYGLPQAVTIKLDPSVTSVARVHEVLLEFLKGAADKAAENLSGTSQMHATGMNMGALSSAIKWEPSIEKLSFEGDTLPLELMFSATGVRDGDEFQAHGLDPTLLTLNPKPKNLYPKPKPKTRNPKPETRNPKP